GLVAVILAGAAGRLPGLAAALEESSAPKPGAAAPAEDFGEALFAAPSDGPVSAHVLAPEATARAAHDLAVRFVRGDLPAGHLDAAPLLPPHPADAGPARLHFRGPHSVLCGPSLPLGRR